MASGESPKSEAAQAIDAPKMAASGYAQLQQHHAHLTGEVLKAGLNGPASNGSKLPSQKLATTRLESAEVETAATKAVTTAAAGEAGRRSAETSAAAAARAVATAAAGEDERRLAETPFVAASAAGALTVGSEPDDGKESRPQFKRFRSSAGSVRTTSFANGRDEDMGSTPPLQARSLPDQKRRIIGQDAPDPIKLRTMMSSLSDKKKPDIKQKLRITAGCSDEEASDD